MTSLVLLVVGVLFVLLYIKKLRKELAIEKERREDLEEEVATLQLKCDEQHEFETMLHKERKYARLD